MFRPSSVQFRAVRQYADYDTFKNMVAAAHLKPINDGKKKDASETRGHLFGADGSRIVEEDHTSRIAMAAISCVSGSDSGADAIRVPLNGPEFQRDWRRHASSPEQKMAFLRAIDPARFPDIFRVEITGTALADIVTALADGVGTADSVSSEVLAFALAVLLELSRAGRFSLNVRLLGSKAKQAVEQIVRAGLAADVGEHQEAAREVANLYAVKL